MQFRGVETGTYLKKEPDTIVLPFISTETRVELIKQFIGSDQGRIKFVGYKIFETESTWVEYETITVSDEKGFVLLYKKCGQGSSRFIGVNSEEGECGSTGSIGPAKENPSDRDKFKLMVDNSLTLEEIIKEFERGYQYPIIIVSKGDLGLIRKDTQEEILEMINTFYNNQIIRAEHFTHNKS